MKSKTSFKTIKHDIRTFDFQIFNGLVLKGKFSQSSILFQKRVLIYQEISTGEYILLEKYYSWRTFSQGILISCCTGTNNIAVALYPFFTLFPGLAEYNSTVASKIQLTFSVSVGAMELNLSTFTSFTAMHTQTKRETSSVISRRSTVIS